MTLPSFHDHYVVGLTVDCETHRIALHIRSASSPAIQTITFFGVEGYVLENDAFGNIIGELEVVLPTKLLTDESARITHMYSQSGAPGPWAADIPAACASFEARGFRGYVLSSSYGMSGWVLAETAELGAQPIIPPDLSRQAAPGR
jgi:hypothetical protein